MSGKLILAVLLAGLLLLGGLLSVQIGRAQKPVWQPLPTYPANRSLVGASEAEVAEYVLAGVRANLKIVSGNPEVRLVRRITGADLPSLGLPALGFAYGEPPLMLVIVRGDFDIRGYFLGTGGMDPNSWDWRVQYMGFVMDLRAGMPAMTIRSARGERFRVALTDPNLPDDHPKRATPVPGTPPAHPTPGTEPTTVPPGAPRSSGAPAPIPATVPPARR